MKFLLIVLLTLSSTVFANDFPIRNLRVDITQLQVWPSNQGVSRYTALVSDELPTECPVNNGFSVESGPGADAAYSTLLAALMAGKQIELYLVRCEYYPVADRVRLIR